MRKTQKKKHHATAGSAPLPKPPTGHLNNSNNGWANVMKVIKQSQSSVVTKS